MLNVILWNKSINYILKCVFSDLTVPYLSGFSIEATRDGISGGKGLST